MACIRNFIAYKIRISQFKTHIFKGDNFLLPLKMSSLKIYKASAGSGKTFTLTREYLSYLIKYPLVYKNILAVTFTNKATAEMKDRILSELFILSTGRNSDHLNYLISNTGINEKEIRKNANTAFRLILHDYTNFSVTTIDSFFQRIFRSFLYELGIKFNFDLLLNDNEVLEEGVKQFLDNIEPDHPATEWLLQFIQERIEDGKSYKIEDELVKSGKEIFKEQFVQYQDELFEKTGDKIFLNSYKNDLHGIIEEISDRLRRVGVEMQEEMLKAGLAFEDFSNGLRGVGGYLQKLTQINSNTIIDVFKPGVRTISAAGDSQSWTAKGSPKKVEIISLAEKILIPKLNEVLNVISDEKHRFFSARLILKNLFNLGLLSEIARESKKYTFNNGYFLLAEIPRFLAQIIGNDGAPFVYEKTGTRFTHYMIDEFQDTSQMQYRNFKPLIVNSLSQGYGNMVVGDVKQSIYRWRNSDWQLLENQLGKDFSIFSPTSISLDENYRSKPNIISFNNALYTILPELTSLLLPDEKESQERIRSLYVNSIQKQPLKKYSDNGFVGVRFFNYDNFQLLVCEKWIPETILFWWKQGVKDIAVLVRENKDIPIVFTTLNNYLKQNKSEIPDDFRVVSGESLSLIASGAVNFLVSLLRYTVNANDLINQGVLLHEYKYYLSESEINPDEWLNSYGSDIKDKIPELTSERFKHAISLPFYEMVEHFIALFNLSRLKSEIPFILNFMDCIRDFSVRPMANIKTFIDWWTENGAKQMVSMNDEFEAVKIVSIHKSKGMQYEAVIIPFPDWQMTPAKHPPLLWCKTNHEPFNKLPVIPVIFNREMSDSYFNKEYREEVLKSVIDNLNLLYVATTRAKSVLEMACPVAKKESVTSVNDILKIGLYSDKKITINGKEEPMLSFLDIQDMYFSIGDREKVHSNVKTELTYGGFISTSFISNLYNPEILIADNSYGIVSQEKDDKIKFGILVHEILASIKYYDEIDQVLDKFAVREKFTSFEISRINSLLREIFNLNGVQEWFDRKYKVLNERTIVLKSGDIKRPDRIILMGDNAIVIDYKTGIAESIKNQNQIRNYVDLLKEMGFKNVEGWLLYTDLLKTEQVV